MKNSNAKRENIDASYSHHYQAAQADLEVIINALRKHDANSFGDRHYGHVGDVHAAAAGLKEIADRLVGRGEYALANVAR